MDEIELPDQQVDDPYYKSKIRKKSASIVLPDEPQEDNYKPTGNVEEDIKHFQATHKLGPVGQKIEDFANKPLLPSVSKEPETYTGGFVNSLYKDFVQPLSTPINLAAAAVGKFTEPKAAALGDVAPIEAPKAIPKQPLALPPAPESLPPIERRSANLPLPEGMSERRMGELLNKFGGKLPNEDITPLAQNPSFIGGPGGVARNVPHQMDMGPINPTIGAKNKGTILNRELGEVTQVPPHIPASVAPVPEGPESFTQPKANLGDTLPGAQDRNPYQQPSAVKTSKITPEPIGEVAPPESTPNIEPPPITKDLPPREAIQRWGYGRNASEVAGDQVKDQFANLTDKPELVSKFQNGDRTGQLKDVGDYFDDRFKQLTKAGVLEPQQYKQNYLRQLWENTPEEVNDVFKKYRIAKKPGLSKESIFQSYEQGINAGLTPRYTNIADIAGAFEKDFNNAIRDQELKTYLKSKDIHLGQRALSDQSVWNDVGKIDPQAAKMMGNYFSNNRPDWLKKTGEAFGVTRNLSLAQGIPTRSGTLSAHGFNLLGSDVMARGFLPAFSDFVKTTYNPAKDVEFIQQNKGLLKKAIESGLDWKGGDYSIGSMDQALRKIPGVGMARDLQQKLLEDPLFKVKAPAMQLKMYAQRLSELTPKIGEEAAAKSAAEFANDFSGHVNRTFKNKSLWDASQVVALAPSWLRTRANIAAKGLTGKPGYVAPLARGAAVGAGIATIDASSIGLAPYLAGKPSEVTGIPAGQVDNKQRNIEPLGTSIEPTRGAMQVGTQLGQGNLSYPFRYMGNKMSQPIQAGINLYKNEDPFGNPLSGKTKYGKDIPAMEAAINVAREIGRPVTPGLISALMDYYQGKAPIEEATAKAVGAPITYTSIPKGKKASTSIRLTLPK